QFLVGPMIGSGLPWGQFWFYAGLVGLAISACLFALLPRETQLSPVGGMANVIRSLQTVFANPQSILCGLISGLLFLPTTIFSMTWGVRFLQDARGREY